MLPKRNPFEVYLLCLALLSGTLLLAGHTTAGSIEEALPDFYAYCWGGMLAGGSGLSLVGMFWPGRWITGLTIKRTGLTSVGFAAFIWSAILVLYFGNLSFLAAGVTLGFAAACFARVHDLNVIIRQAIHDEEPT